MFFIQNGKGFSIKSKVKAIVNHQGHLIVQETIHLTPREVEIVILQTDELNEIQTVETKSEINKPIWEIAEELMEDISEEEQKQLPRDGAVQHDHYIYGTPKINP